MSILLTILIILTVFHYFYQATIVKANHQLLEDELAYQELMLEVYLKREKNNLAPIEIEFVDDFKAHQVHFRNIVKEANLLDYLLFSLVESKGESSSKKKIDSSLVRKELQDIERDSVHVLVRSIFVNSFLFALLLSPLIILALYTTKIDNSLK